jgi:hypothetical protein
VVLFVFINAHEYILEIKHNKRIKLRIDNVGFFFVSLLHFGIAREKETRDFKDILILFVLNVCDFRTAHRLNFYLYYIA